MLVSLTENGLHKISNSMFVVDGNPESGFELTQDLIFMLNLVKEIDYLSLSGSFINLPPIHPWDNGNPDEVIHVVVSKEEAEVLTSLGIQGSWETGFWGPISFFGYRQEGMPVGTTSIATGYYQTWDDYNQNWRIVEDTVLSIIR